MGRPKKDPWEDLDDEFKSTIDSSDEVSIRKKIAEVALNQSALTSAKELDQDLAEKKETYSEAGAVYRDGTKRHKLMIAYCREILNNKGKDTGSFEVE
jgi:hypothetical protein